MDLGMGGTALTLWKNWKSSVNETWVFRPLTFLFEFLFMNVVDLFKLYLIIFLCSSMYTFLLQFLFMNVVDLFKLNLIIFLCCNMCTIPDEISKFMPVWTTHCIVFMTILILTWICWWMKMIDLVITTPSVNII